MTDSILKKWVLIILLMMGCLLSSSLQAETMYLWIYDHTGVILWGYPYFEQWQDTRAQELSQHPSLKTGLQMSGYEVEWYATYRPLYLDILYDRIHHEFSGRYGLVHGAYSDSFGNLSLGETNVRNFYYGKKAYEKELDYDVCTYATQEPTMFATLPTILAGFEYESMLHRTHLLFWGKSEDISLPNHSTIWIEGPQGDGFIGGDDGLQAIPEYHGADLSSKSVDADDSFYILGGGRYKNGTTTLEDVKDYYRRHYEETSNEYVLASCPEDASLNAQEQLALDTESDTWTWYFTTGEDFSNLFPSATTEYTFPINSYELWIPWGRWGYEMLTKPRQAEIHVLNAERMAAIDRATGGTQSYEADLDQAWKNLLVSQHHDLIVVQGLLDGPDNDAYAGGYTHPRVTASLNASDRVISQALENMADRIDSPEGDKILVLINPVAFERRDLIDVVLGSDVTTPFALFDGAEEIAYEEIDPSHHEIIFFADLPSLGYKTFTIRYEPPSVTPSGMIVNPHARTITTDYYEMAFGSNGGLTKLYDKTIQKDILKPNGSNGKFRGKINGSWETSTGDISFPLIGQLMTRVEENGSIGGIPYTIDIYIYNELRRIDYKVTFAFNGEEMSVTSEADRIKDRKHWDDGKLGVLFQAAYSNPSVNTDRPFIVAPGEHVQPTQFNQPTTGPVSSMVGLTWADLSASDHSRGFALFNRGTMAYRSPYIDLSNNTIHDDTLFMPLAWAGMKNPFQGDYLYGDYTYEYALYPHPGDWKDGMIPKKVNEYYFRVLTKLEEPHTGSSSETISLFQLSAENVILSAIYPRCGALFARINEYEGASTPVTLQSSDYVWYVYGTNMLHHNPTILNQPFLLNRHQIRTLFITTDPDASSDIPHQVEGLQAIPISGSRINLSWTPNPDTDLHHYLIYRSLSPEFIPSTKNKVAEVEGHTYSDIHLAANTTYYYKIEAEDLFGHVGPPSIPVLATTGDPNASYRCFSASVLSGSVIDGDHSDLHANDDDYFQIRDDGSGINKKISWEVTGIIDHPPETLQKLQIRYDGHFSLPVTQELKLYNFETEEWDLIDTRKVGTEDVQIIWSTADSATIQNHTSEAGDIKLNISAQSLNSFDCFGDEILFKIEYGERSPADPLIGPKALGQIQDDLFMKE